GCSVPFGCSGDAAQTLVPDVSSAIVMPDTTPDVTADTATPEPTAPDTTTWGNPDPVQEADTVTSTEPTGAFGDPCAGNDECHSGWCVEGEDGYLCTKSCDLDCPEGFDCKSVLTSGSDVAFLCMPELEKNCVPCASPIHCPGGACLVIDGESRCATLCESNDDCPEGYACQDDPTTVDEISYCFPLSESCSCRSDFDGGQRTCTAGDAETGNVCFGVETCDPQQGWIDCSASAPTSETCNVADDDCDGTVDEGFTAEDGTFSLIDHCGGCGNACLDKFPNGTGYCDVSGATPACAVESCDEGFFKASDFHCAVPPDASCAPCVVDEDCFAGNCLELDGQKGCAIPCHAVTKECPAGYACGVTDDGLERCLPASGSCACTAANAGQLRTCALENPVGTCYGVETCDPDAGWIDCTATIPAEEVCDGEDNDCDGIADDGLGSAVPC
ncbi:MAG: hypothetical protein QF464_19590, partial [Myxococcota bacterium]|nr:hypothetical protein [Myxococcota bacterium]